MDASAAAGVEIRDGLMTGMTYALVAARNDWGPPGRQHGRDTLFWGMLKPPYEALKIAEVMRGWGATVHIVNPIDEPPVGLDGEPCYRSLRDVPGPIDCAVISVAAKHVPALLDDIVAAGVKTVWTQYSVMKAGLGHLFAERGIRVVEGCVLLHWDLDHVSGIAKGRHICHIHVILSRAWRIRVDPDTGVAERLPPFDVRQLPWERETFGAKLISPNYPDIEVLK